VYAIEGLGVARGGAAEHRAFDEQLVMVVTAVEETVDAGLPVLHVAPDVQEVRVVTAVS